MAKVTPEEVRQRIDQITEIFGDIVIHADEQASTRCPYRDRHDGCTAKFRCRSQTDAGAAGLSCTHDGTFDYRSAWESNPRAADEARGKIETVRARAAQRRGERRH